MAASEMRIDLLTRDEDAMRIGRNVQPSEELTIPPRIAAADRYVRKVDREPKPSIEMLFALTLPPSFFQS
jgi:hypothetical protein